jgi:hypothetical protein
MSKLQDFIRKNVKLPENMYTRVKEDGVLVGYHDLVFWMSEDYASRLIEDGFSAVLKDILQHDIKYLEDKRKSLLPSGHKEFTC